MGGVEGSNGEDGKEREPSGTYDGWGTTARVSVGNGRTLCSNTPDLATDGRVRTSIILRRAIRRVN